MNSSRTLISLCLGTFAFASQAYATNDPAPSLSDEGPAPALRTWGVEADLLVPFIPEAEIITIRGTRTLWGQGQPLHGDLVLGVFLRPNVEHDIVEEIDEYLFTIGYRQYLWRGLHLEGQVDLGYAWGTRNRIDGRDHNNFAMLVEGHAGYRFDFAPSAATSLYLNPQVGVIHGAITDIGPRGGKSDTFLSAKINLGVQF